MLTEAQKERKNSKERARYAANAEAIKARNRSWAVANPDRVKAIGLKWRTENPDRFRDNARRAARKRLGLPDPTRPEPAHCECCGRDRVSTLHGRFHLDHDHETGAFRGWLCNECNLAIGRLGDNTDGLRKALAYLERAERM